MKTEMGQHDGEGLVGICGSAYGNRHFFFSFEHAVFAKKRISVSVRCSKINKDYLYCTEGNALR